MKILIAGSTGLIGSALVQMFEEKGYEVTRLVRAGSHTNMPNTISYHPDKGVDNLDAFEGFDAWINLAGENIATGYWTEKKKEKILSSRVNVTTILTEVAKKLKNPPKVILNASAIGYYGNRGDEALDESSKSGVGFLSDVCRRWEGALSVLDNTTIRVVILRIGVVLSTKGAALKKMLLPFKMGLGGVIGNGSQYMSWISIDDLTHAVHYLMTNETAKGAINIVSPNPVTNREFTKTLGKKLNRPTIFPMPAFFAKLVMGEMAEEILLSSTRVYPKKLEALGFKFKHTHLEKCLQDLLK